MKFLYIDPVKIALCLARAQMTRGEMCKRCGITDGNMSAILKKGHASPRNVGRIAEALGVDVTEILKDEA